MLATNPKRGYELGWYRGELLALARDLGRRLLPAFNTPTGIPFPRIHLQHGSYLRSQGEGGREELTWSRRSAERRDHGDVCGGCRVIIARIRSAEPSYGGPDVRRRGEEGILRDLESPKRHRPAREHDLDHRRQVAAWGQLDGSWDRFILRVRVLLRFGEFSLTGSDAGTPRRRASCLARTSGGASGTSRIQPS